MDPTFGLLGGGVSLIGSLMGASTQEKANNQNYAINLANYYEKERDRQDKLAAANDAVMERHEGGTNATGDRTVYTPGKGYQTYLSTDDQSLLAAQQKEQQERLGVDAVLARSQKVKNYADQVQQGYLAKNLMRHFSDAPDTATREAALLQQGVNQGEGANYDSLISAAARNALSSNSSNFGSTIAALTKARSDAVGKASASIPVQAEQLANQTNQTHDSSLANLTGFFSGRAAQVPQASFAPTNVTGSADQQASGFNAGAANAENAYTNAAGTAGGHLDYVTPALGYANSIAGAGNLISGLGSKYQSGNDYDNLYAALKKAKGSNSGLDNE